MDESACTEFDVQQSPGEHEARVGRLAWSTDGRLLACPSADGTTAVWDVSGTWRCLHRLKAKRHHHVAAFSPDGGHLAVGMASSGVRVWALSDTRNPMILRAVAGGGVVESLAWRAAQPALAVGSSDGYVWFWDTSKQRLVTEARVSTGPVYSTMWLPQVEALVTGGKDGRITGWALTGGEPLWSTGGQTGRVLCLALSPLTGRLLSGSEDATIRVWNLELGKAEVVLEGHTGPVTGISFSADGEFLASRSTDQTIRIWRTDTWESVPIIRITTDRPHWLSGLAFHPSRLALASTDDRDRRVQVWNLSKEGLLRQLTRASSIRYSTAKVVLVGDSGVGKTGLGWRLAHGAFREHPSSHGQQFWVVDTLSTKLPDGTECEAILWDLAGQPDYRLIHALFLDDADLALVLFDPAKRDDPLHGVDFWVKTLLRSTARACKAILVAARVDRGSPTLTDAELAGFCSSRNISGGYVATSARDGTGLEDLLQRLQAHLAWQNLTATTTTSTFKRIKEYVLSLKEDHERSKVLSRPDELRESIAHAAPTWKFSDDEMMTAVGHLAKHGYVTLLRTASGDCSILLKPELLNNLAASFVLEARRNPKGLGALEESRVLENLYHFPEVEALEPSERSTLLDSAMVLFLGHNVCFRESLGETTFLVFPELINERRPRLLDDVVLEDDVSYSVIGAIENVYAALVVLLGYTSTFIRTNQWQNQAQYELEAGQVCGFRQVAEREGEIELVLYYGATVELEDRVLFRSLVEKFLSRRKVDWTRYPPLVCSHCRYRQERTEVVRRTRSGKTSMRCSECGKEIPLLPEPTARLLPTGRQRLLDREEATSDQRTRFEVAIAQLNAFLRFRGGGGVDGAPTCFISYAWGERSREVWVERSLASDLRKAGIAVVLDRWHNAEIGSSVPRFISRISACDWIVVVGTSLYRTKYENTVAETGSILAAEVDLISQRLLGSEEEKRTVLPLLLEGDEQKAFPALMQKRVHADFREKDRYFVGLFDLILTLLHVKFDEPAVIDLRASVRAAADPDRIK